MDLIDHQVANGLWFTKNGIGFKVGNEEDAPTLYLARYAHKLIQHYPEILRWATENPPPTSNAERSLSWYKELASVFIDAGWHVLWRGMLSTHGEVSQVVTDLRRLPPELTTEVGEWPKDTKVDVYRSPSYEKVAEVSWAMLCGETGQ